MKEFITLTEAAQRLAISLFTLRRKIEKNKIQVYTDKVDERRKLVKVADIEALQTATPTLTSEDIAAANKAFESAKNEPEFDLDEVLAGFEMVEAG